jgi:hypothetical protein
VEILAGHVRAIHDIYAIRLSLVALLLDRIGGGKAKL